MQSIPCPHCGPRAHTEFAYGGDATVERPSDAKQVPLGEWLDHIYLRDNPRGPHTEWWHHVYGCRRWIKVYRDTLTHDVYASAPADGEIDPSARARAGNAP
ncbi:MAG: sarcosine oxidase subunit delta [Gammaproteobacteria bacterium]